MKKIIAVLVVVIFGAIAWFYLFQFKSGNRINAINVVPANAVLIIDVEDPFEQWNTITKGEIWQYLKTNNYLAHVGNTIDSLNVSLKENEFLWNLVASRPVTVSLHKIRGNEFDLFYVVDLTKAARFSFVKDYIQNLVGDGIDVTSREYRQEKIIELNFKDSQDLMYMYVKNNLIMLSGTHVLIENSIDQLEEPALARDLDYLEVSKRMDNNGVTFYLQHTYFKDYISQWLKDENSAGYEFISALTFTGIDATIDDQFLSLSGVSNLNDSLNSYAKIVHNSGVGRIDMPSLVPENSLFFLSMGFESFAKFYENIEFRIKNSSDGEEYVKNKKKLEKYLGISVEENLLSWIGDEAGVFQIYPKEVGKESGYVAVLKANDIDLAKEHLDFIKKQIKKKTPVKFRGIEYKGHQINFLSVKGLFKILLGNMFSKLDKPYYTIINEFVVFSNNPGTLAHLIRYNLEGKTLSENEQFEPYFKQFDNKSSLFLYVNSTQIIPGSKAYLSKEYWQKLNKNKAYIESFPLMGVQIKPEDNLISTSIILNYMPQKEKVDWSRLFLPVELDEIDTVKKMSTPEKEEEIKIDDIFPEDLTDKKLTETYANGQNKFEVPLKNGLKEGMYKEYDSLGNVLVKGRYKKNKKSGVWKYYTNDGDLIRKEKF